MSPGAREECGPLGTAPLTSSALCFPPVQVPLGSFPGLGTKRFGCVQDSCFRGGGPIGPQALCESLGRNHETAIIKTNTTLYCYRVRVAPLKYQCLKGKYGRPKCGLHLHKLGICGTTTRNDKLYFAEEGKRQE